MSGFFITTFALLATSQPLQSLTITFAMAFIVAITSAAMCFYIVSNASLNGVFYADDSGHLRALDHKLDQQFSIAPGSRVLPYGCLLLLHQTTSTSSTSSISSLSESKGHAMHRYYVFRDALSLAEYRHLCRLVIGAARAANKLDK
ncbi:hypothetical protein E2K93_12020 [Thalassotalea sp. HSM 43]|nr:hypothetical protein E2K93_12020 [Thalassotalea sp. HSM 43]